MTDKEEKIDTHVHRWTMIDGYTYFTWEENEEDSEQESDEIDDNLCNSCDCDPCDCNWGTDE